MDTENNTDPEAVLQAWRIKILNAFLAIVAIAATVMTVVSILDAFSRPGQWPAVIVFSILDLMLIALAIFRFDYRIRAWGVLLVPYVVGVTALASFGLGSSGRLYLLVLPIGALILIGVRSGVLMSMLSILTMIVFSFFAQRGMLVDWLVSDRNSLLLADWLAEFSDTLMLLITVMALLIMFYRFQERLIEKERKTQSDLRRAQALLEEQNATLEQKVQIRTSELQSSNLNLEQRNAELALLNSISEAMVKTLDMKTLMRLVGDKMREIFDADSTLIMLLDRQTNLINVPYEYDRTEGGYLDYVEPFPLGTGLSSKVIATGQPLVLGTLEEEIANGAYFPPEIIEKGQGFFSQSWLGVPVITKEQVLGLVALADARAHAFNANHLRLLQTLSANMGMAIENARLFQSEQQRASELAIINSVQNSVQAGLAAHLDMQAIYELVGDKVCEIFNANTVVLMTFDLEKSVMYRHYTIERGVRYYFEPLPIPMYWYDFIQQDQPQLIRDHLLEAMQRVDPQFKVPAGDVPKSAVTVPLRIQGKLRGAVSLQNVDRENAFSESDLHLLENLANSLGAALENARLFDETQRLLKETEQRNAELSIINSVQESLASNLDLQAIYELIGEKVREAFNVQVVDIVIYDPDANLISMPYSYEKGDRSVISPREPYGFRLQVIDSGQPLLINQDFEKLAEAYNNPLVTGEWPKSALYVPLLVDGKAKGVISIQDLDQENAFSPSAVRLLQTLANSMSVALENVRLFTETQRLFQAEQRAHAQAEILRSIAQALNRSLSLTDVFNLVLTEIQKVIPYDSAGIYQVYDNHREFVTGRGFTNLEELIGVSFEFNQQNDEIGYLISQSLQPLILEDASTKYPQYFSIGSHAAAKIRSYMAVPIVLNQQLIGLITLDKQEPGFYKDEHARLAMAFAAQAATAINNARLFSETQQRAAELATINTVSRELAGELGLEPLIRLVGEQMRTVFKADIAYVALLDERCNLINFPYTYGEELTPIRPGEGLTGRIIQTGEPLLINQEMDRQTQELGTEIIGKQARSYLGVPIFVSGKAVGVISVQSTEREGLFNIHDENLLSTLAANVGTALHNAQLFDELREAAEKLRLIFESAFDGIDIYEEFPDTKKRVLLDCNDRYCELAGRSREELMSVENTGIFQRSIVNPWDELGNSVLESNAFSGTFSWIRPDGKENIIEYNAAPTKVGDRHFTVGIDRDVTERKRVEGELRQSNEKLRLIFENAFDGISIYEEIPAEDKRILLDCNDRYCQMAGRSKEELMSSADTRAIQRTIDNAPEEDDREAVMAEQVFSGVFSWIRPDGKENIVEYNAAPTKVGDRYFTIGLDRDITERMRVQEELKRTRADAEQANQAKSAFLANMSHELRTPLNAIIGFTRIVRRKAEGLIPEKQTENLDKVLTSAEHLLNLINTVLDIAKIEAGRMDVLAANFRIASLIDLCANTAQPLVRPGVALEKQVDETLATICSDQDKIRQIVLNLLSNAAKFTHSGKIILSARQDGENLRISVSDTGIGISDEALPRIFKEFQQADNTTTRQYGGTGLGLSISRNLAHLLGGDLNVESELGKGSTFTLVIPLRYGIKPPPSSLEDELAPVQTAIPQPAPFSAKKRLLVIDDDPDAVYLLQENLNQQEYEIIGTRNGQDGLRLAREQQPQAILLDIIMPGADGWQVLHDLKEDPDTANIPVILLTIVDKKALGFRLGAAAYLLKPLDPVAVREALRRVILPGGRPQRHVLLVDDDPNIADMLRQFLPEAEFRLDSALDGVAGLEAIAASHPDILLLDIMMPRLDGFGVIEALRADPQTRDLPIIVISAKDLTEAEATRLKETVAVVMKKQGFQGEKLVDEIKSVLLPGQRRKNI